MFKNKFRNQKAISIKKIVVTNSLFSSPFGLLPYQT